MIEQDKAIKKDKTNKYKGITVLSDSPDISLEQFAEEGIYQKYKIN